MDPLRSFCQPRHLSQRTFVECEGCLRGMA
jgi:hypothetical protein